MPNPLAPNAPATCRLTRVRTGQATERGQGTGQNQIVGLVRKWDLILRAPGSLRGVTSGCFRGEGGGGEGPEAVSGRARGGGAAEGKRGCAGRAVHVNPGAGAGRGAGSR